MATTNLGRVAIVPRGTWSAATTYKKLDLVTFEGSSYIALQNNSNKPVSNTTYWQKIAQKGDQGIQGIQGIQGETGNGIASIELTNTSGAVKTYTITYTNGNTTTFQVTDGEVTNEVLAEELEAYALIDGYYEEMTVGAAENLTGKGTGVPAVFSHRTTGGDVDVADGIATLNKIKGNTLIWNQLRNPSMIPFAQDHTIRQDGAIVVDNLDGSLTISTEGTLAATVRVIIATTALNTACIPQHKYLLSGLPNGSSNDLKIEQYIIATGSVTDKGGGAIGTSIAQESSVWNHVITFKEGANLSTPLTFYPQIFDLTRMFGYGNEPSTVAEFKELFPLDHYNYCVYKPIHFTGESLKTVGFNQWDEVWETGTIMSTTGEDTGDASAIRSKNYIPVFPNTKYCIINSKGAKLRFYDINKNYLGYTPKALSGTDNVKTFTTPDDCYYFRFATQPSYGPTYNNDICLNISWSGYRDGEYEPYWVRNRSIDFSESFPDGLKHAYAMTEGTLTNRNYCYDEVIKNKYIKRIGTYQITTSETFDNQSGNNDTATNFMVSVSLTSQIGYTAHNYRAIRMSHFDNVFAGQVTSASPSCKDFACCFNPGSTYTNTLYLRFPYHIKAGLTQASTSTEKVNAAKEWINARATAGDPVILYYELSEPVEIPLDDPLNLNYIVSDFGTEEILPANTTEPATTQINAEIIYGMNATDTLRRLPENYISKDSMEAFLSTLNTVTNGTWSMTFNSETGKYVFSYVANEQQGGE